MTTVNAGIQQRILSRVRLEIADKSETYICHTLDKIAAEDHRREVQQACTDLKTRVLDLIAPHRTVGDWAVAERPDATADMDQVLQHRLAIIDQIARSLVRRGKQ